MSKTEKGLRLMVYDDSENRPVGWTWKVGAIIFWLFGRFDAVKGVKSWGEALEWTLKVSEGRKIADWRFWGHGAPGRAYINGGALSYMALKWADSPYHDLLTELRGRFISTSLIWFRTCSTCAGPVGKEFMKAWSTFFNCTVAAQTYIIHYWHSGLHSIRPGQEPDWPDMEGLSNGENGAIEKLWSERNAPNTIRFFRGRIPTGW